MCLATSMLGTVRNGCSTIAFSGHMRLQPPQVVGVLNSGVFYTNLSRIFSVPQRNPVGSWSMHLLLAALGMKCGELLYELLSSSNFWLLLFGHGWGMTGSRFEITRSSPCNI